MAALEGQAERFPSVLIAEPDCGALDPRDAGLARAIYEASMRRWLTLEAMYGVHVDRPVDQLSPAVRAALVAGAAQLVLLDRVPVHAAIDETVERVKGRMPKASGLVNAVLRRASEMLVGEPEEMEWDWERDWAGPRDAVPMGDGRWQRLAGDVLPEDPMTRLAVATSVPETLIRRWMTWLPAERVRQIAWSGLEPAPIVVNAMHAGWLPTEDAVPHEEDGFVVYTGSTAALGDWLGRHPGCWVQDVSSAGAELSVADDAGGASSPGMVVDLCAGQGTKTRQLAAVFPDAKIIATDVDEKRFATLARVFAGDERVDVVPADEVVAAVGGKADLVLLDVPCGNSGVIGRRIEARYRADRRAVQRLNDTQRQVIVDAIPMVAEGGRLIYATCSVEREENERVVAWARKSHDLRPRRDRRAWPTGGDGASPAEHRDGAYSCVLMR